jgi:replicative DNA helicase
MVQDISREELVIRLIMDDVTLQHKVAKVFTHDLFDDKTMKGLAKILLKYHAKYHNFPGAQTLITALRPCLERELLIKISTMTIESIDTKVSCDLVTSFFQEQISKKHLIDFADKLNKRDFTELPELVDKLKLAVTLDFFVNPGLDLIGDAAVAMERLNQTMLAIPSSLEQLRALTASNGGTGGYYKKALSIWMGMPNVGKTIVLCNEAAYAFSQGYNVLYVTLEMAEELIWERITVNLTDFGLTGFRKRNPAEVIDKLIEVQQKEEAATNRMFVKEMPSTSTVNELAALIREIKDKFDVSIDMLVVDYLGIMKPAKRDNTVSQQTLYTMGKEIAEQLRDMAKALQIAIVTASQLNRDGYGSTEIGLKNVAGSAGINDTADLLISIAQDPLLEKHGFYMHSILKNRMGPKHVSFLSKLSIEHMRIRDVLDSERSKYEQEQVSSEMAAADFAAGNQQNNRVMGRAPGEQKSLRAPKAKKATTPETPAPVQPTTEFATSHTQDSSDTDIL